MTAVSEYILSYRGILQFTGFVFLFYLGVKSFFMKTFEDSKELKEGGEDFKNYTSTLF